MKFLGKLFVEGSDGKKSKKKPSRARSRRRTPPRKANGEFRKRKRS